MSGASASADRAGGPSDLSRSASQPKALIPSADAAAVAKLRKALEGLSAMVSGPLDDTFHAQAMFDTAEQAEAFHEAVFDLLPGQPASAIQCEPMQPDEEGWSEWIHPLPGYLMQCCDCGLVHEAEFAIGQREGDGPLNDGESDETGVAIFRMRRAVNG